MAELVVSRNAASAACRHLQRCCFASRSRCPPHRYQVSPSATAGEQLPLAAHQQAPPLGGRQDALPRRTALCLAASALLLAVQPSQPSRAATATDLPLASIQPQLAPDQSLYDAADPTLREAAQLLQRALNAADVREEEALWTEIIEKYGGVDANWVPDLVGRAWGNRGNARSRQGKLAEALSDYNQSIAICPWSVDPVLNRWVGGCWSFLLESVQ